MYSRKFFTTAEAEGGSAAQRKWNVRSQRGRELTSASRNETNSFQSFHRDERCRSIAASSTESGAGWNSLHEKERRSPIEADLLLKVARGAENQIVGSFWDRLGSTTTLDRDLLPAHRQPETRGSRSHDQGVGQGDRLKDRRDVVEAVGTAGTDRQSEVELGSRFDPNRPHPRSASSGSGPAPHPRP